jgi:lipoate---protein ligase
MGTLRGSRPRGGGRSLSEAAFAFDRRRATPQVLVEELPASGRLALVCEPTSGAVVLGSTQDESRLNAARCAAAGLDVIRRRSGGGAVVVRPGAQIWIDVFVPRGDPLFVEDVAASFRFLGEAWRDALAAVLQVSSPAPAVVRPGEGTSSEWGRMLCFAALGAGEVTLGGRKVVGISQRRDRSGAWLHSMAMLEHDPQELARLFRLSERQHREVTGLLAAMAGPLPRHLSAPELASAVLARLTPPVGGSGPARGATPFMAEGGGP